MLGRLLSVQARDDGFVTDHDANGKPVGQAEVNKSSLAILAIDREVRP